MDIMLSLLSIILGWLAGIWINHAGNTLPARETLFQTPFYRASHVPKPIQAWSAIIAYLTNTHRCPETGVSIGLRPLLVELGTPLLFLFIVNRFPASVYLLFLLLYTAILVLLTVTDMEHRLIQNVVILPAILLAIIGALLSPNVNWRLALLGGAIGFGVFYLLALLARGGLGSGDVTLSAFLGLIIGFPHIIIALILGIFLGGIISALLLVTRQVTFKSFIPYGPFLIVAGWAMLVWGDAIYAYFWA